MLTVATLGGVTVSAAQIAGGSPAAAAAVAAPKASQPAPAAVLYASPTGTATTGCTISAPCSLFAAQAVVRTLTPAMESDIIVWLRGGTYRLSDTWTFDEADSGGNGHRVIYEAYPGETPLISGAERLTGWTLHDPAKNIWSAPAPGVNTRELYVDGVRAQIDHGPINPGGWGTPTSTGLVAPDASMASWPDIVGTEVVSESNWEHRSCPITTASGQDLTLAQPCYRNTQLPYDFQSGAVIGQSQFNVSWVQNAYELLGTPGQFYLDSAHGTMYYVPRPGENLATADVEAPVLQTLVQGSGTATSPLRDISFSGLTFAYATWLAPGSSSGYAEAQAGWHITGDNLTSVPMENLTPTPGEIRFDHDSGLEFSGDTFTHLGAVGLELAQGSKNAMIVGNKFTDIGSNALQIGSVDTADRHPPVADQVSGVTVRDNSITSAGQVYRSAVGVFVGYTLNTTISHNAIGDLPYTAISVNLGWEGTSYSGGAVITSNEIFQDMEVLSDGGALYTQMPMTTPSVMKYNWLHDESTPGGTPLYLDSTAGNWTAQYNVLQTGGEASRNIQNCCGVPAQHNTVQYNYSNASGAIHGQPDPTNTVTDNWDNLEVMPPEARAIMAQAGLEPQYAYLLSQRTYNDTTSTISYTGPGWNYSSGRAQGDFGDDVHYSYAAGATVTIPFTGSGISWLAQRSDQTGPVEVYIDGADQGLVTPRTSSAPYPVQQVDYSISGLPAGDHTLRIVSQSYQLITVDAFTVSASRPTTDDTAGTVTYAGNGWEQVMSSGAGNYGGTLHTTNAAGASVSFRFSGTGASWVAPRNPVSSPVEVYVDGLDQGMVTPNAGLGPFPAQQVDYSVAGLLPGRHTLKIVNRTAAVLSVDAFTTETGRSTIQDTAPAVSYSGSGWIRAAADQGGCGTDVSCTSAAGAAVTVIATGSAISWVAPQRADTGPVRVYVDGIDEGEVTPAVGTTGSSARQVDYSVTGLVPGVHRLEIVDVSGRLAVGAFTVLN
ncbi:MAG: hypothetical protein JWM19_1706 [Actinomycetia bacterium]|nr:hypothetical protein [Actinomycetes bacterium]